MSIERLINHLIDRDREKEKDRKGPMPLCSFRVTRTSKDLVRPATERAVHHRNREKFYQGELEKAEVELKEKGVTVEAVEQAQAMLTASSLASGSVFGPSSATATLQAKIDPKLLDNVKKAKAKVHEHKEKAERYERWARAFALQQDIILDLTPEDAEFFRLEPSGSSLL